MILSANDNEIGELESLFLNALWAKDLATKQYRIERIAISLGIPIQDFEYVKGTKSLKRERIEAVSKLIKD